MWLILLLGTFLVCLVRFDIVSGWHWVRIGSMVLYGACCVRGGYMMCNSVFGVCRCGTYCGVVVCLNIL